MSTALAEGRLSAEALAASAGRTHALRHTTFPTASGEAIAAALAELDAVGARAAEAALITRGDVGVHAAPTVLDLRRRLNHASGRTGTALLDALVAAIPGTRAGSPDDPAATDAPELVLLTRDARTDPAEGADLARLLAARPDAVVVHAGPAGAAPEAARLVLAHGVGRANAVAVAHALAGAR